MKAFVVMLVMCMGAVLALSLVLTSVLLPRHPLRAKICMGRSILMVICRIGP